MHKEEEQSELVDPWIGNARFDQVRARAMDNLRDCDAFCVVTLKLKDDGRITRIGTSALNLPFNDDTELLFGLFIQSIIIEIETLNRQGEERFNA